MMASGRVSTALLTHSLPLEQTPKAFDMMTNYTDGVGKVVVEIK
jgi:threonine dehydrogenase-like Zn-dependent dehydrogenase